MTSWDFIKEFKSTFGVYQFVIGSDSYIGSTKNICNRCYIQHKNQAFTKTSKHKLFYNSVIKNGWDKFILNVFCVTPNHVNVFSEEYPHFILTDKDYLRLQDLTYYELTVAEKLNLNYYKPSLNSSLLANWSSYNLGSKGYIKKKELKDHLSLSYLNRMYTKDTKELHKKIILPPASGLRPPASGEKNLIF